MASHNSRISELNQDLQNEKEAATRGPTAAAKEHMSRLKQQIQEKDDELQVGVCACTAATMMIISSQFVLYSS